MYKNEYLMRLRKALQGVDDEEAERLIEYYREIIEDGLERGGGECFISGLEPPELVAQNYKREQAIEDNNFESENGYDESKPKYVSQKSKGRNGSQNEDKPNVLVRILMAIICVFVAIVGAIILFAFGCVVFALCAAGLAIFVTSFGVFGTSAAIAFAQIGYGFTLIAISILLECVLVLLGKSYALLISTLCFKKQKKDFKFSFKPLIAGASIFVVGLLIFVISFATLGFSMDKLTYSDNMVLREQEFETIDEAFALVSDNAEISIEYSDDGKLRLEYYEFDGDDKAYSFENGKAIVRYASKNVWLNRGVFCAMANKHNKITLYLPQEETIALNIELSNGAVKIEDMGFKKLDLSAKNGSITLNDVTAFDTMLQTNNGAVYVKNCELSELKATTNNGAVAIINTTVKGEIALQSQNGAIYLSNATATDISSTTNNGAIKLENCLAQTIYCKTQNGEINVVHIIGDEIELRVSNGAITGSIDGKKADYIIDAHTNVGANNLVNSSEGTKKLTARTNNGAINIIFYEG